MAESLDSTTKQLLSEYLAQVRALPNEAAKTHRFIAFVGQAFPGSAVISKLTAGVEKAFTPREFEYEFERDKLHEHRVTFEEAVECFFEDYEVRRNKRYPGRYQLIGTTLGGRRLKIIFQLKPNDVVRIITGWPL
jgi:uncharacterized DUF497 family protein